MPPALRSANYASGDVAASLSCPAPTGIAAGDLLLAVLTTSQTAGGVVTGFSASGWTLAAAWNNGGDSQIPASGVLWKPATSAEPSSYGFSRTGNTTTADQFVAHVHAWSGVDTTSPFAVAPTKVDQSSVSTRNPVPAPSVTVPSGLSDQAMLVTAHIAMYWYGAVATGRWTPPSGMAEATDWGDLWTQMSTHYLSVSAGATGTRTSQMSQTPNQQTRGVALALRPAAAAPSGPETGRALLAA